MIKGEGRHNKAQLQRAGKSSYILLIGDKKLLRIFPKNFQNFVQNFSKTCSAKFSEIFSQNFTKIYSEFTNNDFLQIFRKYSNNFHKIFKKIIRILCHLTPFLENSFINVENFSNLCPFFYAKKNWMYCCESKILRKTFFFLSENPQALFTIRKMFKADT